MSPIRAAVPFAVCFLGVQPASAAEIGTTSSAIAYTYDHSLTSATPTASTSERGPPVPGYTFAAAPGSVDYASNGGGPVYPNGASPRVVTDYDLPSVPAQGARVPRTTEEPAQRAGTSPARVRHLQVAANAAARTPGAIRVGELKLPGVPKGVTGTPTTTGKGLQYQIPRGTPEIDPRVASIRVMDPVTTGSTNTRTATSRT